MVRSASAKGKAFSDMMGGNRLGVLQRNTRRTVRYVMAAAAALRVAGDFFLFGLWSGAKTDDASNQQIPFAVCILSFFFFASHTLHRFTIYYMPPRCGGIYRQACYLVQPTS